MAQYAHIIPSRRKLAIMPRARRGWHKNQMRNAIVHVRGCKHRRFSSSMMDIVGCTESCPSDRYISLLNHIYPPPVLSLTHVRQCSHATTMSYPIPQKHRRASRVPIASRESNALTDSCQSMILGESLCTSSSVEVPASTKPSHPSIPFRTSFSLYLFSWDSLPWKPPDCGIDTISSCGCMLLDIF